MGPGGVGRETLPRLLRKKLLWESEWKTQDSSLAFFLCLSQYPARRLVGSGDPRISGELCYGSAVWFSAWGSSPCRRGTGWRPSFSRCPQHSHSCSVSGRTTATVCIEGVCRWVLAPPRCVRGSPMYRVPAGEQAPISLVHRVQQLLPVLTVFSGGVL